MLYQCSCDQRVIDIPTKLYFMISNDELDRLCTEGEGCQINNAWYKSYIETNGVILTPEEVEQKQEEEYEEDDNITDPDLNVDLDYWE